jgi:hypothetical protein
LTPTPNPTDTVTPSNTPTPTNSGVIPTNVPGSCGNDECCLYSMCGDIASSGQGGTGNYCTSHQRCVYNINTGKWGCVPDCTCPYGCD